MAKRTFKTTPFFVFSATVLLNIIGFFTSSAFLWPWGSMVILSSNMITIALLLHTAFSEPAMDELIAKRKLGFQPVEYFPPENGRVIENEYCRICHITAPKGTKHCRQCNICVENFDHHCAWLNVCVGGKNYLSFLSLVAATVGTSFLSSTFHLVIFGLWIGKYHRIANVTEDLWMELPVLPLWVVLWAVLSGIVVVVSLGVFLSTLNLLLFHLRLVKNGKSTYMILMEKRDKKAAITSSSALSEVKVVSGHPRNSFSLSNFPTGRTVIRDLPPVIPPRFMETANEGRGESPRYRSPRDIHPNAIHQ